MFCLPAKKASSPGVSERQNKNGILKKPAALGSLKKLRMDLWRMRTGGPDQLWVFSQ
ncbi:hypothetical protein SMB34_15465 [Thalassospira permensis NBRC 106175]|uniref:Uncharacterized protein n=1 Tax=Thalassospira permensis NBRC 106175 TaxID=1353532 RepID=A0ABR4TR75_9PROT|nr:hypothetical protein SMB34_15465 [Thalassospira permensis NBRC 106175]